MWEALNFWFPVLFVFVRCSGCSTYNLSQTTLIKLMAGELVPTLGDIRPHGHLKLGRFTQHFVDVLDLDLSPLEFFESKYPNDPKDDLRKYLGRFGLSGRMQVQKMSELSDGQKTRVVFAKLGRDVPHILLLDEPTNHLDIMGIDALAKAINEFEGGMVLVSHDMRLISQVAKEIWMCDNKTITKYEGDILNFKMEMRKQLGIDNESLPALRGDASVKKKEDGATSSADNSNNKNSTSKKPSNGGTKASVSKTLTATSAAPVELPKPAAPKPPPPAPPKQESSEPPAKGKYIPPHLRRKMATQQP